jgi:predicted DNA-binding transcriptional regulator AlpA
MTAPTIDELRRWPPTVPLWPDAASALGLSRTAAYDLVRRGELPVRTLRLGRLLRVPTAELLAVLGIPLPATYDEAPSASTASGALVDYLAHDRQENDRAGSA